jgi:hypothetical protein
MNDKRLEQKRINSIEVHEDLVRFLDGHDLSKWSMYFVEIVAALTAHELDEAISREKAIPRSNIGSFGVFNIKGVNEETDRNALAKFLFLSEAQHKSIANIRVYREYDLDHDLVSTDFSAVDEETKQKLFQELR